jgi:proprotein convertase subtilisin/kexin type 5
LKTFILSEPGCVCPPLAMLIIKSCVSCPSNCVICNSQSCLSCANGYYLDIISCLPCAGNCVSCTNALCTRCMYGFSLQDSGICFSTGGISSTSTKDQIIQCDPGCSVCTTTVSNQVICTVAQAGYYLNIGLAAKCANALCLTCLSGQVTCSSCFDGYTLVGGSCQACLDPYAISCFSNNLAWSILCLPKYSSAASNSSNLGKCSSCAPNCFKCDINGPGNCDPSQCDLGFVQLTDTLNCTACFKSCPVCDYNDLNKCLNCGPHRYSDREGSCLNCSIGCLTCPIGS